jgi:hypothetical protein
MTKRPTTTKKTTVKPKRQAKQPARYTYRRGSDGVDDTWDIYDPEGKLVVSIRFWDGPNVADAVEAAVTEERAKLIVDTLNKGYWW